jgi:hypothetical protein
LAKVIAVRIFTRSYRIFDNEFLMMRRRVDVMDEAGAVPHTSPVTLGSDAASKADPLRGEAHTHAP